ncbi:XRE family transcriptional regulator [Micromonospora aurantiaca]|uniref:XRE family transcriptional regulator n=1 Tax=Micromonospora aurantiaca (nom. illeg.) TaxID=47850 RepID=A0ABQ6UEG5_9ACTN|nr:XRE family transcriptional regulator [Micromonospora aurantiaca]KAB1110179.1 XRE family transcriptional regulator [Micromonospora aurantiaca]UFN93434.1 XRE family transcriptional regulator [Micromonospora aurantiaca]
MPVQPTVHPAVCASGHSLALPDARLLSALATLRDALAPGEALNLPAVLDRTALLDALSVLTTNATTPASATRQFTWPWKKLRQSRGWSQQEVFRRLCRVAADEGVRLPEWPTFKRNLCRWESGTVTASAFYEGLLGRLFGLPGWAVVEADYTAELW